MYCANLCKGGFLLGGAYGALLRTFWDLVGVCGALQVGARARYVGANVGVACSMIWLLDDSFRCQRWQSPPLT